ncbi:MAG: FecR domain-containing protein, partial [Bdellovibrionota bacterium]
MELLLEGAFDRWLVGISAGLFLVSTLLILDDRILFRSASHRRSDLSVIASVALASKDVRRRTSDEVRWLPIRGQEELYANDRLFTGENSQAEVSFLDGTKLGVDAKSLVVIRSQPGSTQLDLERGSVFGNVGAKGKMTLKVGDAISELTAGEGGEPAQLKASLTPAGKTQLTVFSGSVGISVNGRKNVLNKNQSAMLDTQGQVSEIRSFSVELLS